MWKILFNSLKNCKRLKKEIITLNTYFNKIMLPPTSTQHYLVSIRLQRKISFVMPFTIFK